MSIISYFKKIRALVGDKKGAALPEFAVAIFPLIWLFFISVEVAGMFSAQLVLHHAAWAAARCGIVQKGSNLPGDYVKNKNKSDDNGNAESVCQKAAIDATGIGFWHQSLWDITVTFAFTPGAGGDSAAGHEGQYSDLTTTVNANYKCIGPKLSSVAICNSGKKPLQMILKLPHEGAVYTLE
jgi:hypothetical protein